MFGLSQSHWPQIWMATFAPLRTERKGSTSSLNFQHLFQILKVEKILKLSVGRSVIDRLKSLLTSQIEAESGSERPVLTLRNWFLLRTLVHP